jgi:hypothetical protein
VQAVSVDRSGAVGGLRDDWVQDAKGDIAAGDWVGETADWIWVPGTGRVGARGDRIESLYVFCVEGVGHVGLSIQSKDYLVLLFCRYASSDASPAKCNLMYSVA